VLLPKLWMQTYFCLLVRKLVFLNNKECGTFFCLYIIQLLCFYRFFPKEVFWRILLVVMPATDELTSYTYIHVNLEWNCSFCVALGCTTNWTARSLTFFDDMGFSFLRCIHAFTDALVFSPIFAEGPAFLVLLGAACPSPCFRRECCQNFFLD